MKKKLITLDEETANLLEKEPNASETVRAAVRVYLQHISTDGKANLVQAMVDQKRINADMLKKVDELQWKIEETHELMTKIANRMGGDSW